VALLERSKDINVYKKVCTHYIQPNAVPTLKRLGLTDDIEAAGGIRNGGQAWTRWGWLGAGARKDDKAYGYSIRREVLDPLLRSHAAATAGVDFRPGTTLRELIYHHDRIVGIRAEGPGHQQLEFRAQLIVGADGRNSRTAELAGVPGQVKANNRFMYFAYFRNLTLATGQRNQVWYLEPEVAYALPNDNSLTLLACALPKSKLAEFKQDTPGNFRRFFEGLPNGPNLQAAEQVSAVIGMLDMPLIYRQLVAPGLALVGDAALAPDPVWGNGVGWAIQTAAWLVDATAEALVEVQPDRLDQALERYRKQHQAAFGSRFAREADFAQARRFNIFERLIYSATMHNPRLGQYTGPHTTRLTNIRHFPPFKAIIRALLVNLTYREQVPGSIPGQRGRLLARKTNS
jgi:2-polyprenyl-6-methoxyphenol hydroxylase-like FAD-dependent oxidoreductase